MMKRVEQEKYRNRLEDLRNRLRGDLNVLTAEALRRTGGEASGNLSNAPIHMADLGTDNFEQEMSMTLLENEKQILDEIASALQRLDAETFGKCEECGKDITTGRLQALPYARHCIDCSRRLQAREEEMRRATF
jgi:RNA polymerase-binding protein DksA